MMRVEIEQLRAVAREYRRQRDELGAALALLVRHMAQYAESAAPVLASYERIRSHEGRK